jgi:hypothetical protein
VSPRVPGTFKDRPARPVRDLSLSADEAVAALTMLGALAAERWLLGECSVMCAREPVAGGWRWHVSIAHPSRYPSWDEIKTAIYGIPTIELPAGRTFAQLLGAPVREGEWVNAHENCFHLYEVDDPWRGLT